MLITSDLMQKSSNKWRIQDQLEQQESTRWPLSTLEVTCFLIVVCIYIIIKIIGAQDLDEEESGVLYVMDCQERVRRFLWSKCISQDVH